MILRLPVALTVLLSLFTVAFAGPAKYGGRKCGNQFTAEEIEAKESKFADSLSRMGTPTRLAGSFSNYTIPVHFFVIYSGKTLAQGYIP